MPLSYKQKYSFQARENFSKKLRENHPDKIPVIVDRAVTERYLPVMKRRKFLVQSELTIMQLILMFRSYMELTPAQTVYLVVNETIMNNCASLGEIYQNEKDEDGFLYVTYLSQNNFGSE